MTEYHPHDRYEPCNEGCGPVATTVEEPKMIKRGIVRNGVVKSVVLHRHGPDESCTPDGCNSFTVTPWKPLPWYQRARFWLIGFLQGMFGWLNTGPWLKRTPQPGTQPETCPVCGTRGCETWAVLRPILAKANRRKSRWDRFMDWYYAKWYHAVLISLGSVALGAVIGQITKHM